MPRAQIKKEKDIRREFNELLDSIFKKAEEVYKTGKQSRLNLSELERIAVEREERKGAEQITITKNLDQMKKWVTDVLNALEKDFVPKESAVNSAMTLYMILENAGTPEKLGDGLKKWVAG